MVKFVKMLKEMIAFNYGYVVISIEYKSYHACFSYAEAVEWMKCYKGCRLYKSGVEVGSNAVMQ